MEQCSNASGVSRVLLLFIGHFPDIREYRQRTIRKKAHKKKAFVGIHNINLAHPALMENLLDLIQEIPVSHIGIFILLLLRYNKEFQSDKIKPLHRKLMVQDAVDPLSAETLLAEMFR